MSGFQDSVNITDATVKGKIIMAEGLLDGAIGRRYVLPLPYHRQGKLIFTGEGTGPGQMTITINGTDYILDIVDNLTPLQAAELFVAESYGNEDFIVDYYPNADYTQATVDIISIGDSSDLNTADEQVDITQVGGVVAGITNTKGLVINRYPPLVVQITADIAAAQLKADNYGAEAQDTAKDGDKNVEMINQILLQIQGKNDDIADIRIVDEITKQEIPGTTNVPGYNEEINCSIPLIKMNMKF